MKTKKFFMLLAAVLLSASAFAQSGNNEPLKGDVSEDGTVDVADMISIIRIMKDGGGAVGEKQVYWYAGTNNGNAVTADNFIDVATKISESEIPATGSVTADGKYIYLVMPEMRHIESLTYEGGSAVEFSCTDVMGYHIYSTAELINSKIDFTIVETVYYWYVGQTNPSTMTSISPIVNDMSSPGWRLIGTTLPEYNPDNKLWSANNIITTGESLAKQYIAIPANSSACPRDGFGSDASTVDIYNKLSNVTISGVEYKVYETVGKSRKYALDTY